MLRLSAVSLCLLLSACGGLPPAAPVAPAVPSAEFRLSRAQFEQLFPKRLPFYTYEGLVAAATAYPRFANGGDAERDRQEMAAFLANIMQESDSLQAVREYNQAAYDHYCRQGPGESCAPGQQYYGRGPIQLSWNFNYLHAGQALGLDLWGNPDLVATDATVAWKTALWYWMERTGPATMTAHEAMQGGIGFGGTIRAINGIVECDQPGDATAQRRIARRLAFYTQAAQVLEVSRGANLGC